MKFFIVDDDFVTGSKLCSILSDYGQCDVATNGSQAITMIDQGLRSGSGYDLVMIDIHLPCATGWAVLKMLRAREQGAGIKSSKKLIISSQGTQQNVSLAGMYKCDAFLLKPIKREVLFEKLAELGIDLVKPVQPVETEGTGEPGGA